MRPIQLALTLALLAPLATAAAQGRDTLQMRGLPRDVRREAERLWNGPVALRDTGAVEIAQGREVAGDVAVRNGPLTIAGHVTGRVLGINTDVILLPTARIDGDLIVVGGEVTGRDVGYVGGEIRIYRQRLRYESTGDQIVVERGNDEDDESLWHRFERRRSRSFSKLQVASAGAYNRVEGLPINLGPQVVQRKPWGTVRLDAYAVVRTASSFSSSDNDVGHTVRGEVDIGRRGGLGLGAQLYDMVDGVEPWQLADIEVGLASFLFHRDYRDYYRRHGGRVFASLFGSPDASLTASYGYERWFAREIHDPFTLFRNGANWRPNPAMDDALMHVAVGTLRVDTRNDEDNPWAGWYVVADYEHGAGTLTTLGASSYARPLPGRVAYDRGFLDVRRYNRVSPDAQINLRLVMAGWLGGDPLPMQRRLSIESASTVPGFDFRAPTDGYSTGTCSGPGAPLGLPAECDRIALAQVEYRGNIRFGFFGDDGDDDWQSRATPRRLPAALWRGGLHADGTWVLFADAGRGWMVNTGGIPLSYGRGELPPLSSFRTDIGTGIDFGGFGIFVAKALSVAGEPANVFVRLRHRF